MKAGLIILITAMGLAGCTGITSGYKSSPQMAESSPRTEVQTQTPQTEINELNLSNALREMESSEKRDTPETFEARARQNLYENLSLYELDSDKNSLVTKDEFMSEMDTAFREEVFREIDLNSDQVITKSELETHALARGLISGKVSN